MHIKAAFFIWLLFSLWQRDAIDSRSGSYELGRLVGQVFGVVLVLAIAFAIYKKLKK